MVTGQQSNTRVQKARPGRAAQRIRTGSRTLLACVNCKEKKLKVPSCAHCQRLSIACLVEDPTTKHHQPRDYVKTLEERIAYLEDILQRTNTEFAGGYSLIPGHIPCYGDNQASRPSPLLPQVLDEESPPMQSTQACVTDSVEDVVSDLASKVGMLGLNAAGAEPHYLGSSSTFAFSRLISSALLRGLPLGNRRPFESASHDQRSMHFPSVLPDYDVAMTLSNAYFNNIHPQYPFLHEATFRRWEQELATSADTSETLSPVALFFLYMVYAVSAVLLPHCGCSAERLYTSAQLYIDHVLPLDNLEAVQALLCCAMFSLRSPIGPSIWKLSGLALRQCIELGYHRSAKRTGMTNNPLRLELKKRAFWCAFVLDCSGAVTLGRPLGIPYQEVDAELPMDINDCYLTDTELLGTPRQSNTDPPSRMSVAIHVCRLRLLWASIQSTLYSDTNLSNPAQPIHETRVQQLRRQLEDWHKSLPPLPPHVGEQLSLFASADWFEVNYNYSLLLLYRGELIQKRGTLRDDVCLECLNAAKSICHAYRRQFIGRSVGYTWGALHFLLLAGLTYLHCLWVSAKARNTTRPDEVSSTCTDCTMVLTVISVSWAGAGSYRDIFEALAGRTMTMMVDKNHEKWLPSANVHAQQQGEAAQDDAAHWMADIIAANSHAEIDTMLYEFMGDIPERGEHSLDRLDELGPRVGHF